MNEKEAEQKTKTICESRKYTIELLNWDRENKVEVFLNRDEEPTSLVCKDWKDALHRLEGGDDK